MSNCSTIPVSQYTSYICRTLAFDFPSFLDQSLVDKVNLSNIVNYILRYEHLFSFSKTIEFDKK